MYITKRSRRRVAQWNLFFNYFSIAYSILAGIILVPLYLRFLTIELYGAWLAASNVLAWITIVDPGLGNVLMQKTSKAYSQGRDKEISGLLTNGLLLSGIIGIIIFLVGWTMSFYLDSFLNLGGNEAFDGLDKAFLMGVIGTSLIFFSYGLTAFNQGLQSSLGIGLVFSGTQLLSLLVTIFLFYRGEGLASLSYGIVVRGVGMIIGNIGYLIWRLKNEKLRLKITFSGIRELSYLMSFTFFGRAVGTASNNMDAIIVTRYLGADIAPIYTLTKKIPELSRTFLERPAVAFMPIITHMYSSGDVEGVNRVLIRLIYYITWAAGLSFTVFILLNGAFIDLWVGKRLYAGGFVNWIIVIQLVIMTFTNTISNLCYALGNIKGNSLVAGLQGIFTIPLMIIGAKYMGMAGIILGPLFVVIITSIYYYPKIFYNLIKLTKSQSENIGKELFKAAFSATIIISSFSIFTSPSDWIYLIIEAIIIVFSYFSLLIYLSKEFRNEFIGIYNKVLGYIL